MLLVQTEPASPHDQDPRWRTRVRRRLGHCRSEDFVQAATHRRGHRRFRATSGWTVKLGPRWRSGEFNVNVIKALGIDQLLPKRVKKLSGGERQAVSIRSVWVERPTSTSSMSHRTPRCQRTNGSRQSHPADHGSERKVSLCIDHDVYFIDIVRFAARFRGPRRC